MSFIKNMLARYRALGTMGKIVVWVAALAFIGFITEEGENKSIALSDSYRKEILSQFGGKTFTISYAGYYTGTESDINGKARWSCSSTGPVQYDIQFSPNMDRFTRVFTDGSGSSGSLSLSSYETKYKYASLYARADGSSGFLSRFPSLYRDGGTWRLKEDIEQLPSGYNAASPTRCVKGPVSFRLKS